GRGRTGDGGHAADRAQLGRILPVPPEHPGAFLIRRKRRKRRRREDVEDTSRDTEKPRPMRPRICIVAPEFIGPFPNGGVGTACYWEASTLGAAGHDVTVLYTGPVER